MPKVFGICTDILAKDGKHILDEKGNRQFGAIGWYRVVNPLCKLGFDVAVGNVTGATPQMALELKAKGDIWFLKMADNEGIDHIYGTHRDFTGAKLVIDLDDDPFVVNEGHPDKEKIEEKRQMRERMIKIADHIVCSTQQIADSVSKINPYVTVIPNAIDPKFWYKKNKVIKDGKIRIGWMSSGSHFADLPIINPVMKEILEKYPNVEFHFAGMTWDEHRSERFIHHKGSKNYLAFPKWYAGIGIDIAVAPLKDNEFNRSKSNIKWMEAAMLEIPTVASDVAPYRCIQHGTNGFLASNQVQWVKYLSLLIESEELRRKVGKEAKKEVLANWNIQKFLPKYTELFEKLMDKKDMTVVTAIAGGKDILKKQPEYKGVEYVAFVDGKDSQWKTRKVCDKFKEPVMNAKIHKILTHKYIDTPYIVWIDGSVTLKTDPHELLKVLGSKDYAFFKHPGRKCLYDEAEACIVLGKGDVSEIAEQVKEYAKAGIPENTGLCEMTAFIRKNTPKANKAFERWWTEITRFSNRDQISFPVAFKGEKWATIPGSVEDARDYKGMEDQVKAFPGNDYFKVEKHIK